MRRIIQTIAAVLACLLLTLAPPAAARGQNAAPAWGDLSPDQQQLLMPFKDEWGSFPPEHREYLSHQARQWLDLPPEEQSRVRQQFRQWQQMPQEEKEQVRQAYHQYTSLPPERRQQVQNSWRQFHQVTPEKRQEMQKLPQEEQPVRGPEMQGEPHPRPSEPQQKVGIQHPDRVPRHRQELREQSQNRSRPSPPALQERAANLSPEQLQELRQRRQNKEAGSHKKKTKRHNRRATP